MRYKIVAYENENDDTGKEVLFDNIPDFFHQVTQFIEWCKIHGQGFLEDGDGNYPDNDILRDLVKQYEESK